MIVYTGGTFDLFHRGHVNLLAWCRRLAGPKGKVIVGLNTDEFITEYKGRPPVLDYNDRAAIVVACEYVDIVIPNEGGADSKPTILKNPYLKPDMIVIGSDWHGRDYMKQLDITWDWLQANLIALVYVPHTDGISTTDIRGRLNG